MMDAESADSSGHLSAAWDGFRPELTMMISTLVFNNILGCDHMS